MPRGNIQKFIDIVTFPVRALTVLYDDKYGLTSLTNEKFDYVAKEVKGFCLDVGCGKNNVFVKNHLSGNGQGIDVFPYEGLVPENIVADMAHLPFKDASFDTVTFIANINHIPKPERDAELAEAYRCLKPGGNIVVTMGSPFAEVLAHKVVGLYDKYLGTAYDVDSIRGMKEEEEYYLTGTEITVRLKKAGFKNIIKKHFWTQWAFNHLFVGWKALSGAEGK